MPLGKRPQQVAGPGLSSRSPRRPAPALGPGSGAGGMKGHGPTGGIGHGREERPPRSETAHSGGRRCFRRREGPAPFPLPLPLSVSASAAPRPRGSATAAAIFPTVHPAPRSGPAPAPPTCVPAPRVPGRRAALPGRGFRPGRTGPVRKAQRMLGPLCPPGPSALQALAAAPSGPGQSLRRPGVTQGQAPIVASLCLESCARLEHGMGSTLGNAPAPQSSGGMFPSTLGSRSDRHDNDKIN